MRKKILFLFLVLPVIVFALSALLYLKSARLKHIAVIPAVSRVEKKVNSRGTEKITYDIKLYKIKLGSATLTCLPAVEVNGNLLDQIVFETELAHFKDIERIYSEPETYLPVKIERYILNWFKEERISEEYDQKNFTVTITKYKKDNKSERLVIKKDSPMHNAILLPQQVRNVQNLEVGMLTVVNLPTRKFQIRLIAVEDVVVPAGTFRAYHFVSSPKQIEIWVSADIDRIPVKIQGIGKFGYLMVLKQYDKDKPPS